MEGKTLLLVQKGSEQGEVSCLCATLNFVLAFTRKARAINALKTHASTTSVTSVLGSERRSSPPSPVVRWIIWIPPGGLKGVLPLHHT